MWLNLSMVVLGMLGGGFSGWIIRRVWDLRKQALADMAEFDTATVAGCTFPACDTGTPAVCNGACIRLPWEPTPEECREYGRQKMRQDMKEAWE